MSSSVVQTAGMIRPTTDRQDCDSTASTTVSRGTNNRVPTPPGKS